MQTGLEPANHQIESLIARPLRILHQLTQGLGLEPKSSILEIEMLANYTIPTWWQRWDLNPYSPSYQLGALPLSYTALEASGGI